MYITVYLKAAQKPKDVLKMHLKPFFHSSINWDCNLDGNSQVQTGNQSLANDNKL